MEEPVIKQEEKESEVKELKEKLEACETIKNELIELSKKIKADFLNYKKDQEKTAQEARRYANENLISLLLPILDSFERALAHLPANLNNDQWTQGIIGIKNQLGGIMKIAGVVEIEALGKKFDPYFHEAAAAAEAEEEKDGLVAEELQKGYKLHDKVLRPARVKIYHKKEN